MVSLSSIWESVTDTAESLGGAYIAPLGVAWDLATSAFDDTDDNFGTYLAMVAEGAGNAIDPFVNPATLTGRAVSGTMHALEYTWDKQMLPIRTIGTMVGHVAYDPVRNWEDIFEGASWAQAFDVAKDRSTGQTAILTGLSVGRGIASDETNQRIAEAMHETGTWSNMDWAAVGMADPLDKDAWKKSHENSPFLTSMMSGTADFAARWYLDPGVLILKGGAALRRAKVGRPITPSDHQKGIRLMLDDEHYAAYGSRPFRFDPDNLATRTEHYLEWLDTGADGGRMNETQIWVGTDVLRSSGAGRATAGLLADAGKIADDAVRRDTQRHILAVAFGDTGSLLATKNDLIEFNRINDELRNIAKGSVLDLKSAAMQKVASNPELMAHLEGQLDNMPRVQKAVENHLRRLETLVGRADELGDDVADDADTLIGTLDDAGIWGSLKQAPRPTKKGNRRVARESGHGFLKDGKASTGHPMFDRPLSAAAEQAQRIARHPSFTTVFQTSPNSVPLRIITTPLQTAAVLGGKFALGYARAPQRMLDALRTPHLQGVVSLHDWNGATTQLDSMLKGAFISPGQRMELLARAQMARTESAKMGVIEAIERASVGSIAKHYAAKLGEDVDDDFIRVLLEQGHAKRASHLAPRHGRIYAATINDMDPYRAANEAKINQAAHTWRVDQLPMSTKGSKIVDLGDDHVPTAMPLLDTQLANMVPLVDTALIKKVLSREAGWLARHSRAWSELKFEADRLSQVKAAVGDTTQKVLGTGVRGGSPERQLASIYAAMDWVAQAAAFGLRAWKFGVLFRLGYPLRVVADDHLRIWSQIGAMAVMAPLREEWMQNFRYNQATRRSMVAQDRAAMRAEREQLLDVTDEANAAAWRDRDAQIKRLNRRIGGLEGATKRNEGRVVRFRVGFRETAEEIDIVDHRWFMDTYLPSVFKRPSNSDHYERGLETYNPVIHGKLKGKAKGFHEGPPVFAVMEEKVPGFPGTREWTGKTKPIKRVYRGMTEEEWAEAQSRGYIQSDGRGALFPDWEGTNAGIAPSTARHYMPRDGKGIIVQIEVRPEDKWFTTNADDYLRTRERIPLDRVSKKTRVFEMREGHVLPPETWTTAAAAKAKADDLRAQRDVLQANQGMNPDAAAKRIREIESLLEVSKRQARKQIRKKRIGEKPIISFDGTVFDGAFAGPQGDAWRGIASSRQTWDNNMRVGEERAYANVVNDGNWQIIMPLENESAHLTAWSDVLNNQFRQSAVAMHFIKGGTAEEFVLWLKEPAQRLLRKRLGHYANDPEDWAGRVEQLVDNYLGTQAIREALQKGRVTPEMLRKLWPDQTTRPAVHGATVAHNLGTSNHALSVGATLNRWMGWLAVQPTDRLSRHPYFAAVYRAEVKRLHQSMVLGAPEGATFGRAEFKTIEAAARRNALASLKRTLFDIEAHSNAAHVMRFVSPFFAAHQEAVSRWWNIISENPHIARRAVQMFDMPKKLHLVVDNDGEQVPDGTPPGPGQYVLLQWPEAWGGPELDPTDPDFKGYSEWRINLNSFNFVLQNGSPLNPGTGPFLQVPVEMVVNKYTEYEEIEAVAKMLNPYRPGSIGEIVLPSTIRRAITLATGERSGEFTRMWNNNITDRVIAFREANGYREPTKAERAAIIDAAKRETQVEAWLRFGQNALSPFPANPQSKFAVVRSGYMKLWDQAIAENRDYEWVMAQFKAKYGDVYLPLMQSASNNTANIPITNEAVGSRKRHAALLAKVDPRLHGAVIAPEAGDESDYSAAAARYFRSTPMAPGESETYLSYDDPAAAFTEGAVKRGWDRYGEAMDTIVAAATDAGLESWRDSDYLLAVRKQVIAKLSEENPWWGADYRQFGDEDYVSVLEDLRTIVSDKKLTSDVARGDIKAVQRYLELREVFEEALRIRAANGGASTMEAEANADLAAQYRHYFGMLEESNTFFQRNFVHGIIDRDPFLVEAD